MEFLFTTLWNAPSSVAEVSQHKRKYFQRSQGFFCIFFFCNSACIDTSPVQIKCRLRLVRGTFFSEEQFWRCVVVTQSRASAPVATFDQREGIKTSGLVPQSDHQTTKWPHGVNYTFVGSTCMRTDGLYEIHKPKKWESFECIRVRVERKVERRALLWFSNRRWPCVPIPESVLVSFSSFHLWHLNTEVKAIFWLIPTKNLHIRPTTTRPSYDFPFLGGKRRPTQTTRSSNPEKMNFFRKKASQAQQISPTTVSRTNEIKSKRAESLTIEVQTPSEVTLRGDYKFPLIYNSAAVPTPLAALITFETPCEYAADEIEILFSVSANSQWQGKKKKNGQPIT